ARKARKVTKVKPEPRARKAKKATKAKLDLRGRRVRPSAPRRRWSVWTRTVRQVRLRSRLAPPTARARHSLWCTSRRRSVRHMPHQRGPLRRASLPFGAKEALVVAPDGLAFVQKRRHALLRVVRERV